MSENIIYSDNCYLRDICNKNLTDRCEMENHFCQKLFRLNYLFDNALLSDKQRLYQSLYLDADMKDKEAFKLLKNIEEDIKNFVKKGSNLYIYSQICGNGKSAWALRLLQAYFKTIWYETDLTCKGLYVNVPRFLLALKSSITKDDPYVNHIREYANMADLVIWDEVGEKSLTEFEHEHVLSFINTRIDNNKANIYTSNILPDQLAEIVGDRLYSRIINNSINIQFFGQDKRSLNK